MILFWDLVQSGISWHNFLSLFPEVTFWISHFLSCNFGIHQIHFFKGQILSFGQSSSLDKSEKHVVHVVDEFQFLFILSFKNSKDGSCIYRTICNTGNKIEWKKYVQNFCISPKVWVIFRHKLLLKINNFFSYGSMYIDIFAQKFTRNAKHKVDYLKTIWTLADFLN